MPDISHLAIPAGVVYAGLGGCLLSLLVATWQNNWSCRVFFLLALRLAIGWHFLFEGLHKIQSHMTGPTDTNRPFSSEMYFAAAEGPFGDVMRARALGDPKGVIAAKLTPKKDITPAEFAKLAYKDQADLCPDAAAQELAVAVTEPDPLNQAKAAFARWVYGVDARDAKVKFVSNADVAQSARDRLRHIAVMQKQVDEMAARDAAKLGTGTGTEVKAAAAARADLRAAEADLAADANKFLAELKKDKNKAWVEETAAKPIVGMDKITMAVITAIGALLIAGLATPLACVAGAGFLLLTYLTHPAFPWYPLPPNTEGNPLFVNKNVIEALALLAIASFPTGRWMGLDALFGCIFKKPASPAI